MKKRIKTILIMIIPLIILMFAISVANKSPLDEGMKNAYFRAKVTEITDTNVMNNSTDVSNVHTETTFKAVGLDGESKGKFYTGYQYVIDTEGMIVSDIVEEGDIVILDRTKNDMGHQFVTFYEGNILIVLTVLFIIAIIIFGHTKGFKTIYTLFLTCAIIIAGFFPAVLSNMNPIIWSIGCTIYIILSTLIILNGFSKKSLCAILSCMGGSLIVFILSYIAIYVSHIVGSVDSSAPYLQILLPSLDFRHLIVAGTLFGATGAIMDIAVELSASLKEVYDKAKDNSVKSLIESGFTIGRDMIGTMSNTLVMAYLGGSLVAVLGIFRMGYDVSLLVSIESVTVEIIQILVGSLGILSTIPITTIICAIIYNKKASSKKS